MSDKIRQCNDWPWVGWQKLFEGTKGLRRKVLQLRALLSVLTLFGLVLLGFLGIILWLTVMGFHVNLQNILLNLQNILLAFGFLIGINFALMFSIDLVVIVCGLGSF